MCPHNVQGQTTYSNTTNVKVKPFKPAKSYKQSAYSNTTNVKVKQMVMCT